MKSLACLLTLVATLSTSAQNQVTSTTESPEKLVITATGVPPAAPLFFHSRSNSSAKITAKLLVQSINFDFKILQGEAKKLSVEVTGDTEGMQVSGAIADWALRKDIQTNKTYLDLVPQDPKAREIKANITVQRELTKTQLDLLSVSPGLAAGFSHRTTIEWDHSTFIRLSLADGCQPLKSRENTIDLLAIGANNIQLQLTPTGTSLSDVDLRHINLQAEVAEDEKSAAITLSGQAHVSAEKGGKITLLTGPLALLDFPHDAGYKVEVKSPSDLQREYVLSFDKAGDYPLNFTFVTTLADWNGWNGIHFQIPNGAVVPITLSKLPAGRRFNPDALVTPKPNDAGGWDGFLPASGQCQLMWKPERKGDAGELFFTTHSLVDVQVGAGMLRSLTQLDTKIMQGKLRVLKLRLDGPGDIIALDGANVGSWQVKEENGTRLLEVVLTGDRSEVGTLSIQTQHPIGDFPATLSPMRITPVGALRHSGYVRLSNRGAVRLGVSSSTGMMQLAPEQFPGQAFKTAPRQVFVYRFPSAERSWEVVADQILPEVSVSQVLVYKLSETDRELHADIELDIREAPLREWEMRIPSDYAVASVTGAEVAQMLVGSTVTDGQRSLKITFKNEVIGRQLIEVRLARNAATTAGNWPLVKIHYPQAKSVRGHIGVESTLGWKIVPGAIEKLVETPLAYFPKKSAALQQAFRLRDADWSASMKIEALGQSVQADVFHLYSLKEGIVYGSVLINYFVIGAPMNEWKILIPGLKQNENGIGNIIVEGQNVRSWRQDGEHLIVTLHQPTLGGSTLLVSFEKPMSVRGGKLHLGQIQPLDAKNESGFIQVVSPTQVKTTTQTASGLLKLGATELPAEYRLMSNAPSLAAWQYAARGFELVMQVEWYQPSETVGQVVDFATLSTKVSRDGQSVTEATFFVKTRGRKTLDLTLPEGTTLWEVRADDTALNARKNGEQILLPLPAKVDPNEPVKVVIRYGGESKKPSRPVIGVPMLEAPVAITEWTVRSDSGYLLTVTDGDVRPAKPSLTETGFEWIKSRMTMLIGILLFLLAASWGARYASQGGWKPAVAMVWLFLAAYLSISTAYHAFENRRVNAESFEVIAPVVSPGQAIELHLKNESLSSAMISYPWIAVAVVSLLALGGSFFHPILRLPGVRALAVALIFLSALGQHGGAILFFLLLALVSVVLLVWLFIRWLNGYNGRRASKLATAAATAVLTLSLWMGGNQQSHAEEAPAAPSADSIVQSWDIANERLSAEMQLKWNAKQGESIVLLQAPATLTKVEVEGARVTKALHLNTQTWLLIAERDGLISATAHYEMPMKNLTDQAWRLPTGNSAMQKISITVDQPNWEVASDQAVRTTPKSDLDPTLSGADLVLLPLSSPSISLHPQRRNPDKEPTRFFTESSDIYVPSPGVVDGWHKLIIRPVSGKVSDLTIDIPADMMVGDVSSENVEDWRFDPTAKTLTVNLAKPSASAFSLTVLTQRGLGQLPQPLNIAPLRVRGTDSVVGVFALGFSNDAQPDNLKASGLSPVNLDDFDAVLWKEVQTQRSGLAMQKAYRYGKDAASLSLQIEPVAAELRVNSNQVLSLGEERMSLSITSQINIVRAGVFQLSFPIPDGLEIESITGDALRDWSEIDKAGKRTAILQLNGRTQGQQTFTLTFSGASPAASGSIGEWKAPHFEINDAVRQTGELHIVPEQGIRIRAINRNNISQQDGRLSSGQRKGDLSFRLLQADWQLSIGIEKLDPWVRATALQEVSLSEGQTRTRISLLYQVENAAVKSLRMRLPNIGKDEARTVRASGSSVKEMRFIKDDLWEVVLRRGMIGDFAFDIEYQHPVNNRNGAERITPILLTDVRQATQYVSVRASDRLDVAGADTQGWRATDWSAIPKSLYAPADSSVPGLCYHVSEPDQPLDVRVQRHEVADTLKLRVLSGELTTVFGTDAAALTMVDLKIRVVEKHTMRAILPEGAELFSITVNGESTDVVRQDDEHLFYVTPGADDEQHADVRLVFRNLGVDHANKTVTLVGPRFSAPLEKIDWFVRLPEGYKLSKHSENFDFQTGKSSTSYGLSDYQASMQQQRSAQVELAQGQMVQANTWISQGDYKKAEKALSQVARNGAVDAASNEDARVQLRKLRNEQAIIGLNTRRQKIYLDNKAEGKSQLSNVALEEAAKINPLFKGDTNYKPADIDQLLQGNTDEERQAMLNIANRMVSQQLAAQAAPQAIEVTMPQSGQLLHFHRSIQLNADSPMSLELEIQPSTPTSHWPTALLLTILLSATALFVLRK